MKEIILKSRDNIDNRLIQINEKSLKFKLKTDYNYRIGFKDNAMTIGAFIDPAGGPFISIGDKLEGYTVKAIYNDGTIELTE